MVSINTHRINLSIDSKTLIEFDKIVKVNNSDRSKMLRKWIRENKVNDIVYDEAIVPVKKEVIDDMFLEE